MDFPAPAFKTPRSTTGTLSTEQDERNQIERMARFLGADKPVTNRLELYENEEKAIRSRALAETFEARWQEREQRKAKPAAQKPKTVTQRMHPDRTDIFEREAQANAPRGVRSMKPISAEEEKVQGGEGDEARGTGTDAFDKKGLGKRLGALFSKKKQSNK